VFSKECPWCGKKITFSQLGQRPSSIVPRWYQFSRSVKVCPYCSGAVKVGGRGLWCLFLVAPMFIAYVIEIFFGVDPFIVKFMREFFWGMLAVGVFGAYWLSTFEKSENT